MKSRLGFVSNSSSSSFVIIGVELDEFSDKQLVALARASIIDKTKKIKDADDARDALYSGWANLKCTIHSDGDNNYFGATLWQNGDDDYGVECIDFKKAKALAKEVAKILETAGLSSEDVSIIGGKVYS